MIIIKAEANSDKNSDKINSMVKIRFISQSSSVSQPIKYRKNVENKKVFVFY